SPDVVGEVMDQDALDEVVWLDVVEEAAKDPVVDLQVLGREARGRSEPVCEFGRDDWVEFDDVVLGHGGRFLYATNTSPRQWCLVCSACFLVKLANDTVHTGDLLIN